MTADRIELKLDDIETDGGTQPRVAIDEGVVSEYAELNSRGIELPPVIVFHDGATYWLADGFHRYHARRRGGYEHIKVEVRQGMQRDAVLYSAGANAAHGLRRSRADKRKAVLTLLEDDEWSQWSDRQIAKRCGVGHQLVARQRSILDESSSMDSGERRFIHPKTGKPARMKTANIGRTGREAATPAETLRREHPKLAGALRDGIRPAADAEALLAMLGELSVLDDAATRRPGFWASWAEQYAASAVFGGKHWHPDRDAAGLRRWTDRVLAWLAWQDGHLADVEPGRAAAHVCELEPCDAWGDFWHAGELRDALAPDMTKLTDGQRAVIASARAFDFEADPFEPLEDETGSLHPQEAST